VNGYHEDLQVYTVAVPDRLAVVEVILDAWPIS